MSTKTAGGLKIIENNTNGCFFSLDKQDSLTLGIKKILSEWGAYSDNARESFEFYSMEKQIDAHRDLLVSKLR